MKTIIRLIALLAIVSCTSTAQQKSDYALVQRFQSLTKSVAKSIDQAKTVQECAEANTSIDAIEKEFGEEKTLINKANYPISSPRGLDIIFSPKMMTPILARIQDDFLTLFVVPSKEKIETGIQATDRIVVENTLYVKNEGNLLELVMNEIGGKIIPSVKCTWNIMPKSSLLFNSVIYQNVLGKAYLVIPRPEVGRNSSCHIIATPELDGYKILDAKHENRICMVTGVKGTDTVKFVFTFDPTFSNYDYRLIRDDQLINFVVLDNGVCVSINDDSSIELFRNITSNKVQIIKDPDIKSTMTLTHDGVKVMFFHGNILYTLSVKK